LIFLNHVQQLEEDEGREITLAAEKEFGALEVGGGNNIYEEEGGVFCLLYSPLSFFIYLFFLTHRRRWGERYILDAPARLGKKI
jgi:hypothetical protein